MLHQPGEAAPLLRRLAALGWDYLLIVGWLVLLAVGYLVGIRPLTGASLVGMDLVITGITVLPVWVYLVLSEAAPAQATWGKRRARLIVTAGGGRPGALRIVVRNTVKLLPWELAHLAILRFWTRQDDSVIAVPALVLCYALVGVTLALVLLRRDRAGLHDLVGGTRVVTDGVPVPAS